MSLAVVVVLALSLTWSYWPTLVMMIDAWTHESDYSHGFLVPLVACGLLWIRRAESPGLAPSVSVVGISLLATGFALRCASAYFFIEDLDGWSLLFWAGGLAWLLGGRSLFHWALPAIGFLVFMIPLPYRVERWLSLPLQSIATKLSSWVLQLLGQPALAEGNVILMGDEKLFVEEACSGMRIFVGIAALAYALSFFLRSPMWERMLLFASVPVMAVIANSARIVLTAVVIHWLPENAGESARTIAHDLIGLLSIPLAAVLFFWAVGFLRRAFPEEEVVDAASLVRRRSLAT